MCKASVGVTSELTVKQQASVDLVGPRWPNSFQVKATRLYLQARPGLQLHAEPSSARSCRRSECERRAPASTPGIRCNCYS